MKFALQSPQDLKWHNITIWPSYDNAFLEDYSFCEMDILANCGPKTVNIVHSELQTPNLSWEIISYVTGSKINGELMMQFIVRGSKTLSANVASINKARDMAMVLFSPKSTVTTTPKWFKKVVDYVRITSTQLCIFSRREWPVFPHPSGWFRQLAAHEFDLSLHEWVSRRRLLLLSSTNAFLGDPSVPMTTIFFFTAGISKM